MARPRGVRVIAGSARGRRLVTPPGDDIRPTTERVREALFSALDARGRITGAVVLDLYSGTGALGIEAMSRGARRAVLVERDRRACEAIAANLATIGISAAARIERRDAAAFVASLPPAEAPFDLVLADPPYDVDDAVVDGLLAALAQPGWLAEGAFVVVERPRAASVGAVSPYAVVWERTFGDTLLAVLST